MNSTKIMKSSARPIVLALVLMNIILVGAITVFQEHNTLKSTTFITNQSLKIVMATVRFDNVSESVRNFPNVLVSTLDFGKNLATSFWVNLHFDAFIFFFEVIKRMFLVLLDFLFLLNLHLGAITFSSC